MKEKILAIFGIGTYILSILSSATDLAGNYVAPTALIVISGFATILFVIMATVYLWKEARGISVALASSAIILSISSVAQSFNVPAYGSLLIIFLNIIKIISFIASILAIIKLFKIKKNNKTL